ncbi:PRTRC system protein B [Chryseobacterium binzhouense]|uniref:PRTRC system protein B n=1 Tax=Chryseobacterium binzhouense TaxID=2593646 RepID=UPI0028A0CC18|nr:PRTRC system protein B [Chryseobacterium binzhouense]
MTKVDDITESFGTLYYPKSALVFYQTDSPNSDSYVEYFDMNKNGNPINAHPLTLREAQRLSKSLHIQNKKDHDFLKPKGIIPSNILYTNSTELSQNEKVVWFTKAQKKDLFFVGNLNIPNGKANIPPLLWVGNRRSLKVFAFKSNTRPNENTPLFHAPFFNIYQDGSVCMGTVDVNITHSASLEEFIKSWENYFFNSYFSHLMNEHNPIKGNCVNLWKNLVETKEVFPKELLITNNKTLKHLL